MTVLIRFVTYLKRQLITQRYTYGKKDKLKSRKEMEALFKQGKSFSVFPVKVLFRQPETAGYTLQTGVGAGSRHFKRAVHRNRIKRLMRESYRLHVAPLQQYLQERGRPLAVFLLYIDKVLPEQELLHQKMPVIIRRLIKELNEVDAPAT